MSCGKGDWCNFTHDVLIAVVFGVVSLQFLFPGNAIVPLDRRLSGLLGATIAAIIAVAIPNNNENVAGESVEIEVLVILVSIMVINFVILRQSVVDRYVSQMKNFIIHSDQGGFWLVSFISFIVSPFVTNDGLCLLLVNPVLDALEKRPKTPAECASRFYFMLTISSCANIGSVMTFAGNPQNIIIADSLSKLMNGGTFFALILLPAFSMCFVTAGYINYRRLQAMKSISDNLAMSLQPRSDGPFSTAAGVDNRASQENVTKRESITVSMGGRTISIAEDDVENFTNSVDSGYANSDIRTSMVGLKEFGSIVTSNIRNYEQVGFETWVAIGLFVILVILELSGALELVFIFAVIAVVMVASVILIQYYTGKPNIDNNGTPIDNKSRRRLIQIYVNEMFKDIDYDLIVIFIGIIISAIFVSLIILRC